MTKNATNRPKATQVPPEPRSPRPAPAGPPVTTPSELPERRTKPEVVLPRTKRSNQLPTSVRIDPAAEGLWTALSNHFGLSRNGVLALALRTLGRTVGLEVPSSTFRYTQGPSQRPAPQVPSPEVPHEVPASSSPIPDVPSPIPDPHGPVPRGREPGAGGPPAGVLPPEPGSRTTTGNQ